MRKRWSIRTRCARTPLLTGRLPRRLSFLVNFRGRRVGLYRWNAEPVNIDVQPSRLWDWRDLQFLRRQ
jgi:hypothetical protein